MDDPQKRLEELAGYGWRYRAAATGDPLERLQDAIARATEFAMLRGPGDDDLPHLRELGYDPGRAAAILENIRTREAELAAYLTAEPATPERLAEYISARAWVWDLGDDWNAALADAGLGGMTIEEVGRERIHAVVAGVPIVVVESAVRQGRFRNGQYRWERNDIFDIGFIGHAVVYCDAVLTDKDVRRQCPRPRCRHALWDADAPRSRRSPRLAGPVWRHCLIRYSSDCLNHSVSAIVSANA